VLDGQYGDGDRVYGASGDDLLAGGSGDVDYCSGGAGFNQVIDQHGCELVSGISP
jgi:hypothetical protein